MNPHPATPEQVVHILETYREVVARNPNQIHVDSYYRSAVLGEGPQLLEGGIPNIKELFQDTSAEGFEDQILSWVKDGDWESLSTFLEPLITLPALARENFEAWEQIILGCNNPDEQVIEKVLENQ